MKISPREQRQYQKENPSFPTGRKKSLKKVLAKIYKRDFYEHMCFVLIWLYYMTGIRVSEGLALNWNDVDFKRKKAKNSSHLGND